MKTIHPLECTLLLAVCTCLLLPSTAACDVSVISGAAPSAVLKEGSSRRKLFHAFNSSSSRYQKPYNICISQWMPLVWCRDLEYEAFHGYSVELWGAVAAAQGLEEGADWSFTCYDSQEALLEDLQSPAGNCTMSATGVPLNVETTMTGSMKFSWPFYKSGFSVVVTNRPHKADPWLFGMAFHWSVWILLVLTTVMMGVLVTLAEVLSYGAKANRRGFRGWFWYSLGKMLHFVANVGDPQTWASRILVLAFGFTILIIAHLFTAVIANKMLSERMANMITSKADLAGRMVGCWTDEVATVRKYGMRAVPFEGEEDLSSQDALLNKLRLHEVEALMLDTPAAMFMTSHAAPACDLFIVGEPFDTYFLSFAFPSDAPDVFISNISAAILQLQLSEALLDKLENEHIQQAGPCRVDDGTGQFHMEVLIGIAELQGLWYVMAACLIVSLVMSGVGYANTQGGARRWWHRRWWLAGNNQVAPAGAADCTNEDVLAHGSRPCKAAAVDLVSALGARVDDAMVSEGDDGSGNQSLGACADRGGHATNNHDHYDRLCSLSPSKAPTAPAGSAGAALLLLGVSSSSSSSKQHRFAGHLSKLAVGSSPAGSTAGSGGGGPAGANSSEDGVLLLSAGAGHSRNNPVITQPFDAAVVIQSRPAAVRQLDEYSSAGPAVAAAGSRLAHSGVAAAPVLRLSQSVSGGEQPGDEQQGDRQLAATQYERSAASSWVCVDNE